MALLGALDSRSICRNFQAGMVDKMAWMGWVGTMGTMATMGWLMGGAYHLCLFEGRVWLYRAESQPSYREQCCTLCSVTIPWPPS